jgi:phage terminase large subunit
VTAQRKRTEEVFSAPSVLDRTTWPPNYTSVFAWRQQQLARMRKDPAYAAGAKEYYKTHPVEFICHWCDTFDPRNSFKASLPTRLPLVLFKRQAELVRFVLGCVEDQENGLLDKSRDTGATWVCSAVSIWLWLFKEGSAIGWGSRKQDLVDRLGDPTSIFEKMRKTIRGLPDVFLPEGFDPDRHLTYLRFVNPENDATIVGEGGDNIGRGGRTLVYFKDESAHYEHPESIEAALMDNTNVQIDISTHNGVGTIFDQKRSAGREWNAGDPKPPAGSTRVFVLDWSDHPAKTPEWHKTRERAARDNGLLHLFRQEVDRDPTASLVGVIIPQEWVRSAVDAHVDLGFGDAGGYCAGFDPADEGGDLHALAWRKGLVLRYAEDWGEGDTGDATRTTIRALTGLTPMPVQYDCIGIGAGVKSEANRLVAAREMPQGISFHAWDAGLPPKDPEARIIPGDHSVPKNEDFYYNLKGQGWWNLRLRFERTHRMKTEKGTKFPADQLISLDSRIPKLRALMRELSQPVVKKSSDLRLLVDKKPEGARSPNMGDAVMMCYFPVKVPMIIPDSALKLSARR